MGHFTSGKTAIQSKDWDTAIGEFRASLHLVDSPNARLELARALRDSGKPGDAWLEYGQVIETATRLAGKEERYAKTADAATTERTEVESKLAFVTVSLAHAPDGATLSVGGRDVPREQWANALPTAAGTIDVKVTDADGKELARKSVTVAAGERPSVSLDANPRPAGNDDAPSDDKPSLPATPDVAEPSGHSSLRPFAYVLGGVGAAGIATFAVFGLLSNSAYNDLHNSCHPDCPPDKANEASTGRTEQAVANVGLAAGIFGLAAGATFWFISASQDAPPAKTAVVVGPAYLGLRGSL